MYTKIKEIIPLLEYICGLPANEIKPTLQTIKPRMYKFLLDFLLNVMIGKILVAKAVKKVLKQYKKIIASILKKGKSLKRRVRELTEDPGLFRAIFKPLLAAFHKILKNGTQ